MVAERMLETDWKNIVKGEMVAEWQVSGGNSGAKEEEGRQNSKWVEGIVGNVGNVGVRWTKPCGWDG